MRDLKSERLAKAAAAALGTEPDQLPAVIRKLQKEINDLEAERTSLEKEM